MFCIARENIACKRHEPGFKVDLAAHFEQAELSPRVGPGAIDSVVAIGSDGWGVEDVVVDLVAEFCGET